MTNPTYVEFLENEAYVVKNIPRYSLTKGINEKKYRAISEQVTQNLPTINDWLTTDFLKKNKLNTWNNSIRDLHNSNKEKDNQSNSFRRIVYDEICAHFLTLSENRKRIKSKKKKKYFSKTLSKDIENKLPFKLTFSQKKVIEEINLDLQKSNQWFKNVDRACTYLRCCFSMGKR